MLDSHAKLPNFSGESHLWRNNCPNDTKISAMRIISILFFVACALFTNAQDKVTTEVSKALKAGDAASLAKYFTPNVDLAIGDAEDVYSSAKAKEVVANFFSTHRPAGFEVKHEGTSKLDDQYRIGDLKTSNGNFRVTFFMKKTAQGMRIKQLRIESEDF